MSVRRLLLTTLAMASIGVLLATLTPDLATMARTLSSAQRTVDLDGPDALVLSGAGLLGWVVWAWGGLGLVLTAATALPGAAGALSGWLVGAVLPAGVRRTAALALGLGLGVATPLLSSAVGPLGTPASAAVSDDAPSGVPDWPTSTGSNERPGVPDWPASSPPAASPASHVVVPGDCLWDIALARLLTSSGGPPTDGEVARSVADWWTANRTVIGADADLLLPGQVLEPPDGP